MKIAQNVALLKISHEPLPGHAHICMTWDEKNLVLIDAGWPDQLEKILSAIAEEGFDAKNLTHLILTHQDFDHVGCVRELRKLAPNMSVIAHSLEAPYINGEKIPLKLASRLANYSILGASERKGVDAWKKSYETAPNRVDMKVEDSQLLDICGGIKFVHTPGHTPGHICVLLQESNIVVTGDAANIKDGQIAGSNPVHTADIEQAERSLEVIKNLRPSGVVAYHTGYLPIPH